MSFDPKRHLIKVQGNREYLPVAARVAWFRDINPDWGIVTTPVEINLTPDNNKPAYAIFQAHIFNAEGKLMATGTKMEDVRGFGDFLEKAETGSVGRALAMAGFGTANESMFEEGTKPDGRGGRQAAVSDSPQNAQRKPYGGNGNTIQQPAPPPTPEEDGATMTDEHRLNLAGAAWVKEAERLGWKMRDENGVMDKKLKASLTSDLHVFMEREKPGVYTAETYDDMRDALPRYAQSLMSDETAFRREDKAATE